MITMSASSAPYVWERACGDEPLSYYFFKILRRIMENNSVTLAHLGVSAETFFRKEHAAYVRYGRWLVQTIENRYSKTSYFVRRLQSLVDDEAAANDGTKVTHEEIGLSPDQLLELIRHTPEAPR